MSPPNDSDNYFSARNVSANKSVKIIAFPFKLGQQKNGVQDGPSDLLNSGLESQLSDLGWTTSVDWVDCESLCANLAVQDYGKLKNANYVERCTQKLSNRVTEILKEEKVALTIGGDHSLALGTVSGVLRAFPDACLLWIDAHADINSAISTPSGNMHGCPLSFLIGEDQSFKDTFNFARNCLDPSRLAYIGLRELESAEKKTLAQKNIAAFSMHHVDKYGIGKVVEMALKKINPHMDRKIHMSFDVDALDPTVVPGTGTKVRNGLTWREGLYICEAVTKTNCLTAIDIVEINTLICKNEAETIQTLEVACSLVRAALGEKLI